MGEVRAGGRIESDLSANLRYRRWVGSLVRSERLSMTATFPGGSVGRKGWRTTERYRLKWRDFYPGF